MKSARIASALLFALLSLSLIACGDDLDDKQVSEISQEDAQTLCEEQSDYVSNAFGADAVRGSCVLSAGLAAGDMCAEATQTCVDEGNGEIPFSTDCTDVNVDDTPDCDVTVGEVRACFEALVDKTAAEFASITCDDLGMPSEEEEQELPAACVTYFEKCPEAAGDAS